MDTLLEAGITVVVISPSQLRGRYGSAGSKDDRFDIRARRHVARRSAARYPSHGHPAPAAPAKTSSRPPGCVGQSAARAPARRLSELLVGLFADLGSPISLAFLTFCPVSTARTARTVGQPGWLAAAGFGRAPRPAHRAAPPVTRVP